MRKNNFCNCAKDNNNQVNMSVTSSILISIRGKKYNTVRYYLCKTGIDINRLLTSHSDEIYKYLDINLCNILIQCNADIDIIDKNNRTPLFYAVKNNDYEMVKLLLNKGANVNIQDSIGYSCLHIATIRNSNIEIIKALIDNKIDLNAYDWIGRTPLHISVIKSNFDAVKLLVRAGAYINVKDRCRKFPIYYAVSKSDNLISGLLLKHGANPNTINDNEETLLHMAVTSNNILLVEQLLLYGAKIDNGGYNTPPPIVSAVNINNYEIVKMLLQNGANVNINTSDGRTSLHVATIWCNTKIIDELLNYGSDVNSLDIYGKTPLSCYMHLNENIATKFISRIVMSDIYHDTQVNINGFSVNLKTIENNDTFKKIRNNCFKEIYMLKNINLDRFYSSDIFIRCNTNICLLSRFIKHPKIKELDNKLTVYKSVVSKRKTKAIFRYYQVKKVLKLLPHAGYFSLLPIDMLLYILDFINDDNNIAVFLRALQTLK
ncbi:SWPV1-034 [Shearwaterpox virus]|uniref:SWPV1-034 n=1 Tax=Shearwaterpox virus TaxID=1974596 RepID=A0A1V0QGS2_CNPV|nr:SWPV1-034 [Shearwaterpox virus]